jgi:cysteine desulfurase
MKKAERPIYLDYSATAPLRPEAKVAMEPYWSEEFGNPSSVHGYGREALDGVDEARRKIAEILDCLPSEIIFTSGGTEADNLAILGLAGESKTGHIVTSAIEHKAILSSCRYLENRGWRVTYIKPNKFGVVSAKSVIAAITPATKLVSIMYANNEVGTIQPIREIGKQIEKLNRERKQRVVFHTDAVQGGTLLPLGTKHLHVDMLTLSGHKLGGPKGTGILFTKTGVVIHPRTLGGGQESGRRSGTLNVPGIMGMAAALIAVTKNHDKESRRLAGLQKSTITALTKLPGVVVNGDLEERLPSNINISIQNKTSDELVIALDRMGIAVSAASACASGSIQSSYVIEAMGLPAWRAASTLRISMGYKTTAVELKRLVSALKKLL